jgi:hypothetical protein
MQNQEKSWQHNFVVELQNNSLEDDRPRGKIQDSAAEFW